ncbi:hypothetical protein EV641_117118 [Rhodococcus sp. SMB37]|uniref:hypothetical protein n=1 Tax=Rhodococcus sp. SMB37 TaxID=2512213 RepID=UPI0006D1D6F5|nr:hypothetical protein [Rhodococcus sp. SMB37]TCN49050.1 hypothetical protein EV641_117118 [Rhodococcus sp. SMB37]
MTTFRKILGYSVATVATVPLVLAGSGVAQAMGPQLPGSVYFTSTSNSITAHIDASRGITWCALFPDSGNLGPIPASEWTDAPTITMYVEPGTYTVALYCDPDMTNVKQEQVNVPPSLIDQLIDLLETGSS